MQKRRKNLEIGENVRVDENTRLEGKELTSLVEKTDDAVKAVALRLDKEMDKL